MALDPRLAERIQRATPGDLISLYEIDATSLGGDYLRFCNHVTEEGGLVSFGGNIYSPVAVEVDGFEVSTNGALPTPTLRVENTQQAFLSAVISLRDMVGAKFYRIRTFREHLDDGTDPDVDARFPIDQFVIERKVNHSKRVLEWELSAVIDQQGRMLPGRQVLKDSCRLIYRRWDPDTSSFVYTKATCPYAGTNYFNAQGSATTAPNDRCGKKLSDCKLRFGDNAELPFGGFPGVTRIRGF